MPTKLQDAVAMCGIGLILGAGTAGKLTWECDAQQAAQPGPPPSVAEMREELRRRGPDQTGVHRAQFAPDVTLDLIGSVLHLRGDVACEQPLIHPNGDALVWNGEIFGGYEVPPAMSDTVYLMGRLQEARSSDEVLGVFLRVEGPGAFVYWEHSAQRLWFGRDVLGRRSLLWHRPSAPSDALVVCSVAAGGADPRDCYAELTSSFASTVGMFARVAAIALVPNEGGYWEEVPTDQIFCVHVSPPQSPHLRRDLPLSGAGQIHARVTAIARPSIIATRPLAHVTPPTCERTAAALCEAASASAETLLRLLSAAVRVRVGVATVPIRAPGGARIGVLFSGGLDSLVLAALAHAHVPPGEPIELINVAFDAAEVQAVPRAVRCCCPSHIARCAVRIAQCMLPAMLPCGGSDAVMRPFDMMSCTSLGSSGARPLHSAQGRAGTHGDCAGAAMDPRAGAARVCKSAIRILLIRSRH